MSVCPELRSLTCSSWTIFAPGAAAASAVFAAASNSALPAWPVVDSLKSTSPLPPFLAVRHLPSWSPSACPAAV